MPSHKKVTWIVIGLLVVALAIAGIVYSRKQKATNNEQALKDLEETLKGTETPAIDIPESSLGEGVPELNPVQATNPFEYRNPFE